MAGNRPCLGINAGNYKTCMYLCYNGHIEVLRNEFGKTTTPSAVGFTRKRTLVGEEARLLTQTPPRDEDGGQIFYKFIKHIRNSPHKELLAPKEHNVYNMLEDEDVPSYTICHSGRKVNVPINLLIREIFVYVRNIAESYMQNLVTDCVLSVPSRYTPKEREIHKRSAITAGFNVWKLVEEPIAAALAYGLHKFQIMGKILVFDFTSTNLHLTQLEKIPFLGETNSWVIHDEDGDQLTAKLTTYCHKKFGRLNPALQRKLFNRCAEAKKQLSCENVTKLSLCRIPDGDQTLEITREEFYEECADFIMAIKHELNQVYTDVLTKEDIQEIIIIGGNSLMMQFQQMIQSFFPNQTLNRCLSPVEVVAHGAAIAAGKIINGKDCIDLSIFGSIPISLGIEVAQREIHKLIPRGTVPPYCASLTIQKVLFMEPTRVFLYEGESLENKTNIIIARLEIPEFIDSNPSLTDVELEMRLDLDGMLEVSIGDGQGSFEPVHMVQTRVKRMEDIDDEYDDFIDAYDTSDHDEKTPLLDLSEDMVDIERIVEDIEAMEASHKTKKRVEDAETMEASRIIEKIVEDFETMETPCKVEKMVEDVEAMDESSETEKMVEDVGAMETPCKKEIMVEDIEVMDDSSEPEKMREDVEGMGESRETEKTVEDVNAIETSGEMEKMVEVVDVKEVPHKTKKIGEYVGVVETQNFEKMKTSVLSVNEDELAEFLNDN